MESEHRYILKPTYEASKKLQKKALPAHYNSYNKIMNQLNLVAKYPMPPPKRGEANSAIRNDEYLIMNTKRNADQLSKFDSYRQVRSSTSVLDRMRQTQRECILTDRLKNDCYKMGQTSKSNGLSNSMTLVN